MISHVPAEQDVTQVINSLVSLLFASRTQAHIFHFKTSSYSAHKALDKYYSEIVGLTDSLVESYQGKYGIISDYTPMSTIIESSDISQMIAYFTTLEVLVEDSRKTIPQDSYIQNQVDTIVELIHSTNYKLKFLN